VLLIWLKKERKGAFVKLRHHIFIILFTIITFQAYSGGSSDASASSVDNLEITARGAIGRLEAAGTGPLWTGDGGKNIRLAILAPEVHGEVPGYLPIYIQGLLNNNFGKFSAVNLIDRQNLDRIISEQNIAGSGRFSERDFVRIGNLANAQYFLFGTIQRLSGNRFSLQLSVTEASSGVRKATFMKEGTLSQLEGRAALINEATAELLTQLGVQLTEAGRQELLAGNISTVQAQTGLAKGITAQAGGSEVAALFNFTQAITFDPSQMEALSRLNTLSTTISGGTISERITNDIQARDRWIEAFKETTRFFNNHPPFEIIFDPNLMQIGETDYAKRTATLGMRIALDPSKAGFDALNALLEGLEKTGRRSAWGFSGWPLLDISPRVSGTVVFGGKRSFSYKVDVALLNESGKRIGNGSVWLKTEEIGFSSGDKKITLPRGVVETILFPNIKYEDLTLTQTLTIEILTVNGISSKNLASSGYMRVITGNLERRWHDREMAERQIKKEHEEKQQQKEREREIREAYAEMNFFGFSGLYQWSENFPNGFGIEVNFYWTLIPYLTIGFDSGFCSYDIQEYYKPYLNEIDEFQTGTALSLTPIIGLVYPIGERFKIFSNIGLEIGIPPTGRKGILANWITPSLNMGLLLGNIYSPRFIIRYRLTWYESLVINSGYENNLFNSIIISFGSSVNW